MAGLSRARLERMDEVLAGHVSRRDVLGIVALVNRHDDRHVLTAGTLALDRPAPVRRDSIFRIASLTKPMTAVAAMVLVEERRLRLDESVEPWLPELANRRVLRSLDGSLEETVPASRAITLRDLMTFRMGFGSVMAPPGTFPIQQLIRDLRIGGDGPPVPAQLLPPDEWLRRLGTLPWMAQPGEQWLYHVSSDVLGVLIARVAGRSLGEFLRERLFAPLGMKDTAFQLSAEKRDRFPVCYAFDRGANALRTYDDVDTSAWLPAPPFESGGGGLVSTADDCLAFYRMLLNKGRHGGDQVISRAAVALMTSDQLTLGQRMAAVPFLGLHRSWGFGMAVETARDQLFRTPGRFGWDGGLGTSAYADPAESLIGVLLTQRMMESPEPPKVFDDFWNLAYGAVT